MDPVLKKAGQNFLSSNYTFKFSSLIEPTLASGKCLTVIIPFSLQYFCQRPRANCGRVVGASDSGSGGRGFDSQPSHVVIALGKQFTLTFPSPPTCKMGTQLQAMSL